MAENRKLIYKNIIGDTKDTIDAIQRFLDRNEAEKNNSYIKEEQPAHSINRVIKSVLNEDVASEIQKIINNL